MKGNRILNAIVWLTIGFLVAVSYNGKDILDTPLSSRPAPTGPHSPILDATVERSCGTDIMCFSCHDYDDSKMVLYTCGRSKNHSISSGYPNAMAVNYDLVQASDPHGTGLTGSKLFNDYMRCISCHDDNSSYSRLLRQSSS